MSGNVEILFNVKIKNADFFYGRVGAFCIDATEQLQICGQLKFRCHTEQGFEQGPWFRL